MLIHPFPSPCSPSERTPTEPRALRRGTATVGLFKPISFLVPRSPLEPLRYLYAPSTLLPRYCDATARQPALLFTSASPSIMRFWFPHISLVLLASFLPEVFSQATSEPEHLMRRFLLVLIRIIALYRSRIFHN